MLPPALTVNGWPDIINRLADLPHGSTVCVYSARGAGAYAGPGWWLALIAAARQTFPDLVINAVLDCDDSAGAALAAMRAGVDCLIFRGDAELALKLDDIARQCGARLLTG